MRAHSRSTHYVDRDGVLVPSTLLALPLAEVGNLKYTIDAVFSFKRLVCRDGKVVSATNAGVALWNRVSLERLFNSECSMALTAKLLPLVASGGVASHLKANLSTCFERDARLLERGPELFADAA